MDLSRIFLYTMGMVNKMTQRICIIGGGVCGLAIAYALQSRGMHTTLFESAHVGSGATHKSGGMLAGGIENEPSEQNLWHLSQYAQSLWDGYVQDIERISGISVGYQTDGTMMVATTQDDLQTVQFLYDYQTKIGVGVHMLSARDIRKMEPHLKTVGGMWCKTDYQLHSMDFTHALATTIQKLGGDIQECTPVDSIVYTSDRATGVCLSGGTIHPFDSIVVCAGVYTPNILQDIMCVPIRPLKGQMLSLKMPQRLIQRVVWAPKTYLIPKLDGTLYVGANGRRTRF